MPFIWDDWEWKLIGDHVDYDRSRFVIARKLFVRLKPVSDSTNVSKE